MSDLLYVISTLSRVLGHKLRTPLSVISNEVVYLQNIGGASSSESAQETTSLVQQKVRECVEVLKKIQIPGSLELHIRPMALDEVLGVALSEKVTITCDGERTRVAFEAIFSLIAQLIKATPQIEIELVEDATRVVIQAGAAASRQKSQRATSLTEWVCGLRRVEEPAPCIADLLLIVQGIGVSIEDFGSAVEISVTIPGRRPE